MQPTTFTLFLALLLALVTTHFPLQTEWIVTKKRSRDLPAYLIHGALHYGIAALFLVLFAGMSLRSWSAQGVLLGLIATHLLLDLGTRKAPEGLPVFLLDQSLRLIVTGLAAMLLAEPPYNDLQVFLRWFQGVRQKILVTSTVYVTVIFAGGTLIRHLVRLRFRRGTPQPMAGNGAAGMYIGWVERFLVLTALLCRSPEAVGLILAAKSIARFPELKNEESAEYFLLGTLLSVGLALAGGLVLYRLLYGTISLQ